MEKHDWGYMHGRVGRQVYSTVRSVMDRVASRYLAIAKRREQMANHSSQIYQHNNISI